MRKSYPYLEESYVETANETLEKRNFLSKIDSFVNQKRYVNMTLLNWKEEPLKEIQGEITGGTITVDGSSSVRRSCSLNTAVDAYSYDVEDVEEDFAINKKIFIEIGIKNYTDEYPEYPILWFPQGIFFIKNLGYNSSTSSAVNITLTLADKMSMLNGDVGGTLPAATIFDTEVTQTEDGATAEVKVPIYRIIQEAVNHFGGEDLNNIVIEDVPLRIKRIMQWTGDTPLYLVSNGGSAESGTLSYIPQTEKPTSGAYLQINNGDDAGYVYDDFTYGSELTCNAGETVCSLLDKIKSYLGNYEYYYDVFGVFHFQEIKNYLNTTQATLLLEDMDENSYLVETSIPKTVYTFSDDSNLLSINSAPQYTNIKNDFIVQGLRKATNSDISYSITYHLAIDTKPQTGVRYTNILAYKELETEMVKLTVPIVTATLPEVGEFNTVYKQGDKAYVWDDNVFKEVEVVKYFDTMNPYVTKDWRTQLYVQGLVAERTGSDTGYYFAELKEFWPQIYNVAEQRFYGEEEDEAVQVQALCSGNYFLDFIDSSGPLGKYSVNAIGRRTHVTNNDDINCLFEPEIPNIVFINIDLQDTNPEEYERLREECQSSGQPYAQTRGEVFNAFMTGGYHNSCWDQITLDLYKYTNYQRSVSVTALPVYYLDPNVRIYINDKVTNTYGDFMLQNFSIPLDIGSVMSATLNECVVKR